MNMRLPRSAGTCNFVSDIKLKQKTYLLPKCKIKNVII